MPFPDSTFPARAACGCLPVSKCSEFFKGMRAFRQIHFELLPLSPYFATLVFALYSREIPGCGFQIKLIL
jgi:hypothetical protein